MTGRVCEKHGEWCPDGVCRWCPAWMAPPLAPIKITLVAGLPDRCGAPCECNEGGHFCDRPKGHDDQHLFYVVTA